MLVWNWHGGFIDACVTQSVLLLLYTATWIRMRVTARIVFVEALIFLLALSCITWIIVTHFAYEYAMVKDLTQSCSAQEGIAKDYCVQYFFFSALNISSFNSAVWIFASRYWIFSHLLSSTLKEDYSSPHRLARYNKVIWIGLALIQILTIIYILLSFYGTIAYTLQGCIIPFIYVTSTVFLANGLLRIRGVMKEISDEVIIYRAFFLHLSALLLFLVACTVPNFVIGFTPASASF